MATGNPRNKVVLSPGRSLMDWVRLSSSGEDLSGTGGRSRSVTSQQLSEHRGEEDAWTAIRGTVYNVTRYLDFHPGGHEELMRAAGQDGTDLFNNVHRWVNAESMLKACVVGPYLGSAGSGRNKVGGSSGATSSVLTVPSFPREPAPISLSPCRWLVQGETAVLTVGFDEVDATLCVLLTRNGCRLTVVIYSELRVRVLCWRSDPALLPSATDNLSVSTGSRELKLSYQLADSPAHRQPETVWPLHGSEQKRVDFSPSSLDVVRCQLVGRQLASPGGNCLLLTLELPEGCHLTVPLGCHVMVGVPDDTEFAVDIDQVGALSKPYTPVPPQFETLYDPSSDRIHLLIKVYSDGWLTSRLASLSVSTTPNVTVSVPLGVPRRDPAGYRWLLCLAAGSGVTPMLRLTQSALFSGTRCSVQLAMFNRCVDDIMWHDQLEAAGELYCPRLRILHVLSCQPDWPGRRGHVTGELLAELLSVCEPRGDLLVAVCGPPGFMTACREFLTEAGVDLDSCDFYDG